MPPPLRSLLRRITPLRNFVLRRRFRRSHPVEFALLHSTHHSPSSHPSVLFFTSQKCASTYAAELFRDLAVASHLTPVDFDSYLYFGGPSPIDIHHDTPRLHNVFKTRGYYYGPIRHPNRAIPNYSSFRILLLLRDPRDVLTSLYFSVAYSHIVPHTNPAQAAALLARRETARRMTIDEFVRAEYEPFLVSYEMYCEDLVGQPFVHFTRYEEMILDQESWIRAAASFAGLTLTDAVLARVRSETEKLKNSVGSAQAAASSDENILQHRRQVLPGDHERKLQRDTIDFLNEKFAAPLHKLGYI